MLIRTVGVFALATAALASGCVIRETRTPTTPVGTTEVASADIDRDIYNSPAARYDGKTVYYYNGRWMYRDEGGWKYYTREPPELYRNRTQRQTEPIQQQRPPAPHYDRRPEQPPQGTVPPATTAPPSQTPTTNTPSPIPTPKPMPPGARPVEPPPPPMPPGAEPVEPPPKPMPPGAPLLD